MLAGVVPTPAVALLRLDLGVVITASHNPPEYNGVKFFDRDGRKLSDAAEEEIEALLDAPAPRRRRDRSRRRRGRQLSRARRSSGSAADLSGLRIAVDCANGAYAGIAPRAFERARRRGRGDRQRARTATTSTSAAARPTSLRCSDVVTRGELRSRHRVRRRRRSHARGRRERRRRSTATRSSRSSRLHLGVDLVAVTTMTNLGFHRLMEERGVRVITTDVGDRYVLEALYREGGILGGEQSGHIICLRDHVTGDGLASALLLCGALGGRPLVGGRRAMERYPAGEAEPAPRWPRAASAERCSTASTRSTPSSTATAACSCGRPARSPSSGFSRRPRRRRRPKTSVLGSPRS